MATNGTLIDDNKARLLADNYVSTGINFQTIDKKISDMLSGVKDSYEMKIRGIENLKKVGYCYDHDLTLNIIMQTLKQNFSTFIDTWKWAKNQGIQPILDRAIPINRCKLEWIINPQELKYLMNKIGEIEGVYHRIPFLNNEGCNRMGSSVHIEVNGDVYPCGGIQISAGNVKKTSLDEIWHNSELLNSLKNYKSHIHGKCKTCKESDICYGCRGVAYAMTGDIFASDPLCWKNEKGEIYK